MKAGFWRLNISANYLCLDSDCVFIRPFYENDFLAEDKTPFTVLHQNKEYFQLAYNRGMSKAVINFRDEAKRVQALFGRGGPAFYCAPLHLFGPQRSGNRLIVNTCNPEVLLFGIW